MAPTAVAELKTRFPEEDIENVQVLDTELTDWLAENATSHHLVVLVGTQYEANLDELPNYPSTWFLYIDVTASDSGAENVVYGSFSEGVVSYAAGYVAGLMSESKAIGVVAGIPFPAVRRLFNGFRLGVQASCPECAIHGVWINSFNHYDNAISAANHLVNDTGVDVVYGCAGSTGSYAIYRAAELGAHVIGVDVDEFYSTFGDAPDALKKMVVTSAMKKVDVAIEVGVALLLESPVGSAIDGIYDGSLVFDYANGAVGLADCHSACSTIGSATWQHLITLENLLALGSISVDLEADGTMPMIDIETELVFQPALDTGVLPPSRTQHAMAFFSSTWTSHIVVFGGAADSGEKLGDMWLYEIENARWMSTEMGIATGPRPPALSKACLVGMGSFVLLYGGRDGTAQSSEIHLFEGQPGFLGLTEPASSEVTLRWTQVAADDGPGLESAACAAANESCFFVFGGRAAFNERRQLHRFCLDSSTKSAGTWTQLWPLSSSADANAGPEARQGAGLLLVDGDLVGRPEEAQVLVVAGGSSSGTLRTDVWCYGLSTSTWTSLPDLPFGLESPPVLFVDDKATSSGEAQSILVVQLTSTTGAAGMGAMVLDLTTGEWIIQIASIVDSEGAAVSGLSLSTAVRASGQTWLFGGSLSDGSQSSELYTATFTAYADCPGGSEADGLECVACSPGKVSAGGSAARCVNCTAGTFANQTGLTLCSACPIGSFSEAGWGECEECQAGWTTAQAGSSVCLQCSPGHFSHAGGRCIPCPVGSYSESYGQSACVSCLGSLTTQYPGTSSPDACLCAAGTYRPAADSARESCLPCPEGMTCSIGSDWRNIETLEGTRPMVVQGYMSLAGQPEKIYLCMSESHCPGGNPGTCSTLRDSSKVACGECMPDAFFSEDSCRSCEESLGVWPVVLFSLVAIAVVICLVLAVNRDMVLNTHGGIDIVVLAGITISSLQTLGLFNSLTILWFKPFDNILEFAAFLSIDLEVLQLNCMFSSDPLSSYLRTQFPAVFSAVVVFVVLRVKKRFDPQTMVKLQFSNAMGTILNMFFISVLLMNFRPFLCYRHPGTSGASLRSFPSIICDAGVSEFIGMVVVGAAGFLIIQLPFVTLAVYSTCKYPQMMSQYGGESFLKATGFLFFKFTPPRYYYGTIMMTKSLLLCLVPVVIRDQGGLQVLCLITILVLFGQVQMYLQPWRSAKTNIVDGSQSMMLVLVLACGALAAEMNANEDVVAVMGVACFAAMLFVICLVTTNTIYRLFQVVPFYHNFLCHHKADAAGQARYLKMMLDKQYSSQETFLDSDHLKDLDQLFDIIKTRVGRLVAYLTRGTLTRPWCCGEVTTSFRSGNVKVLKVVTSTFIPPTEEQIQALHDYVDFASCSLAKYGITTHDIQVSLRWFLGPTLPALFFLEDLPGSLRYEALLQSIKIAEKNQKTLLGGGGGFTDRNSIIDGIRTSSRKSRGAIADRQEYGCLILSTDTWDSEAIAAGSIVVAKIKSEAFQKIMHGTIELSCLDDCQQKLASRRRALVEKASALVVVLSAGSLSSDVQLQTIVEGMSSKYAPTIIPLTIPGFFFPTEDYFTHSLQSRLRKRHAEGGEQYIRNFFKLIALSLTTFASDQMITAQCAEVVNRLPSDRRSSGDLERFSKVAQEASQNDSNSDSDSEPEEEGMTEGYTHYSVMHEEVEGEPNVNESIRASNDVVFGESEPHSEAFVMGSTQVMLERCNVSL